MFGFSYYLLLPLARGTNGNGYSSSAPLLPTPLASDTGDVGKGLDIQISANGSYRKMNKDGYVDVPTKPGLGLEIDEDLVKEVSAEGLHWTNPKWRNYDGTMAEW